MTETIVAQPTAETASSSAVLPSVTMGRLALVAGQLLLIVLVMRTFRIDELSAVSTVAPLILVAFIIHALLPSRFRVPFFLLFGVVIARLILGPIYGPVLVLASLGMIGLCHLPIVYGARVGVVIFAGASLVAFRVEWMPSPGSFATTLVPVLAAMFMFRIVLYLYSLRHETERVSIWQRIAYFFLFPNIFYFLFPVIDFKTFRRTYYDRDETTIYQKGVLWMLRGIVHILLYRLVYYHLLPSPANVENLGGVIQHVFATYALYLRVSGQFHLIIGMLCLFGFNLPETHHLYWLTSSFTDYWRRINIYWKDFMMTIIYYPAMMRLRRWGMTAGMVLATILVFGATWFLHSYQWFWLHGSFPLRLADGMFWGVLCVMVVMNSLREANKGPRRKLKGGGAGTSAGRSPIPPGWWVCCC